MAAGVEAIAVHGGWAGFGASLTLAALPAPVTAVFVFVPALNPPALGTSPAPVSEVCKTPAWDRPAVMVCVGELAVVSRKQKLFYPAASATEVTAPVPVKTAPVYVSALAVAKSG